MGKKQFLKMKNARKKANKELKENWKKFGVVKKVNFKNRVSSFAFKKEKTGMSNEGIFSIFSILRKSNVHSTTFHFECK